MKVAFGANANPFLGNAKGALPGSYVQQSLSSTGPVYFAGDTGQGENQISRKPSLEPWVRICFGSRAERSGAPLPKPICARVARLPLHFRGEAARSAGEGSCPWLTLPCQPQRFSSTFGVFSCALGMAALRLTMPHLQEHGRQAAMAPGCGRIDESPGRHTCESRYLP